MYQKLSLLNLGLVRRRECHDWVSMLWWLLVESGWDCEQGDHLFLWQEQYNQRLWQKKIPTHLSGSTLVQDREETPITCCNISVDLTSGVSMHQITAKLYSMFAVTSDICVFAIGNNEHDIGTQLLGYLHSTLGLEYIEPRIEIQMFAVGDQEDRLLSHLLLLRYGCLLWDDKHRGVLTVTGNVGTAMHSISGLDTCLSANYSAVIEICVLALGDDEHGGMLAVTGDVSTPPG
ncbi:hypothetical protein EDC04DRAFT_2615080 [Pisolithus marmoratus]|nr:hypothetical protein EDC04DRAFT_2615080 [Pisolithus marmoratus]